MIQSDTPPGYEDHIFEEWRDERRGRRMAPDTGRWECWVLTRDDIEEAAERMGVNPESLTEDKLEDIALCFKKGFEASLPDWEPILECAVEAVMG